MTKRTLYALLFVTALLPRLQAQPAPCDAPAAMTSTCDEACVVCDIDGFTGINNSGITGQAPPGFCTTIVHHMQWIAFIAGSTNLVLEVEVFNCQNGDGLEIGIYQSSNCQNFQLVSNCDTDVPENTTGTLTTTVPLTIGQYYYLVMDGNQGDVCNYTISVVQGSTAVPPLTASGVVQGDFSPCAGPGNTYSTTGETGASAYLWTLDDVAVGSGQTLSVDWPQTGTFDLCVTASNACDEAPPSCQTITVAAVPPPTQIAAALCAGECFAVADTNLCDPGNYVFHLPSAAGCDSVVNVALNFNAAAVTDLSLNICDGDSLFVGGQPFFQTGQYSETLTGWQGCDSTVNLDLNVIICQITGDIAAQNLACFGASTGALTFSVADGTPPFSYAWTQVGPGGLNGQGNLAALGAPETIGGLPVGTYLITVSDNFGNQLVLIGEISGPPPLSVSLDISDYNGYGLSCAGAGDGALQALPAGGGGAPYVFSWNTGSNQPSLGNLPAGDYSVTVSDALGCTMEENVALTAPAALLLAAVFEDPDCEGPETGAIRVDSLAGGAPPYVYDLSGGGFGGADAFAALAPGGYTLTVRDANGCTAAQSGTLTAPLIPAIILGEDRTIDLGEEVFLQVVSSVPLDSVLWSPVQGLSCFTCLEPNAIPTETTTYVLTASSFDGCFRSDSITLRVNKTRNVYIPNVFSPNDDGLHDRLVVFGGKEVTNIAVLQVYSRWGELVYEGRDFPPNDLSAGWDGAFRGKPVNPGVFTWLAQVEFLDGLVLPYQGSVTVLP